MIDKADLKKEILIGYGDTPCFGVIRHTLKGGGFTLSKAPSVWAVTDGEVIISGEDFSRRVGRGEYFFLPYAARGRLKARGEGVMVECLPGRQEGLNFEF